MEDNHPEFSSLSVGILFSSYTIMAIITSFLVGDRVGKFGRKRALILASCAMTVATLIFALAGLIENGNGFYAVSLVARMT